MSPWVRLEAVAIYSSLLVTIGGATVLLVAWIGLAIMPILIKVLAPLEVLRIFMFCAALMSLGFGLILMGRASVICSWRAVLPRLPADALVKAVDEWVTGHGFIVVCASGLVPLFATAFLSLSPWLALGIASIAYVSIRYLATAQNALAAYKILKTKQLTGVATMKPYILAPLASLVLIVAALFFLTPDIGRGVRYASASSVDLLAITRKSIEDGHARLAEMEALNSEATEIETRLVDEASDGNKKGLVSAVELDRAKTKLLSVKSENIRSESEARARIARLEQERVQYEREVLATTSAAPALATSR